MTGEQLQYILLGIIALGLLRLLFRAWVSARWRKRQKKEWQAMGKQGNAPARRSRGAFLFSGLMVIVLGWLFLPGIIVMQGGEVTVYTAMTRTQVLLGALWLFFCLRLMLLLLRGIWRFIAKPRPRPVKPAVTSPVSLVVRSLGASPSRPEMERQLPEYAAALLTRAKQAEQQRLASERKTAAV